MDRQKIAVVILNWNGRKLLEQFLPSVIQHSPSYASVYVADNASTDDSVVFLKEKFPGVKLIVLDKNWGFSAGYNKALAQIDAEYYVLLNSDVEVTPNWIEPVVELLDSSANIAACQPKIRSWHNKTEFEYAGAAGGFIDKWGYPLCRGRIFHVFEEDHGQYDDVHEIFWASGASLFIRAELYHSAGGLDEDFFAHMEEIDLCWRLKNMGYSLYYEPRSLVYHVGGGTLLAGSPRKTFLNFRNSLLLMTKNLRKRRFIPIILLRLVLDGVAALSFLPKPNGWGNFQAVVRAHFSYYTLLGKMMKKRKSIPHRSVSCVYKKSVVFAFFLKKKRKFSDLGDYFTK